MAANRYGQIWHGDRHHINIRFPSTEARLKFQNEFEAYHASHDHEGDVPTFISVTTKDLKLSTGSRSPQDLVKAETDKDYRITIDGYSWNEIHDYHNPSGFSNYFWYHVPTCCVPPIIVVDREFVDSGTLQRHELSAVFGDMPETDFQSLLESVQADGFIDPIIRIHEGHILDGWHRYCAAQELNLIRRLRFREWREDRDEDGDPKAFVLARNIERRHLAPQQRGQIVVAFNNRFGHGGDRTESKSQNGDLKTRADLAKEAGVGTRTIDRAIAVDKAGQSEAVISGEKTAGAVLRETVLEQLYQNRQDFQTAVSDFAQSGAYLNFAYCRRRITSLVGLEDSTDEGSTDYTHWDLQKIKAQSHLITETVQVIRGYLEEDPKIEESPIATLLSEIQRLSEIHQSAKLNTYTRPFQHQPLSDAVERIEKLWTADWEAKSDEERLDDLNELETELPSLIEAENTARADEKADVEEGTEREAKKLLKKKAKASKTAAPAPDDLKTLWKKVSAEIPKWKQRYKEGGKQESELVSRASKSQLIHVLREYRETEQGGAATIEELKDLLQLLKNNSYPLAYRLRQIVRPEQPEEELRNSEVAHRYVNSVIDAFRNILRGLHVVDVDEFLDDILHFFEGIAYADVCVATETQLKRIVDLFQPLLTQEVAVWPEYIRNHRSIPKRELVLVSIGINNNTDDEFEVVEFTDESSDEIRCDLNALPEALRTPLLKIASEKIYAEAVKEFHTDDE